MKRTKKQFNELLKRVLHGIRSLPSWLPNSKIFNQNLILSPQKQININKFLMSIIDNCKKYKMYQKYIDFEVLCANLLRSYNLNQPISVPMNRKYWSAKRWMRTSYFVLEAIKILYKGGFIKMKKGTEFGGIVTRIWPSEGFMRVLNPEGPLEVDGVKFIPVDLVNLRGKKIKRRGEKKYKKKRGNLIDYKDNRETRRVRKILKKVNSINNESEVDFIIPGGGGMTAGIQTNLYSVYNADWFHGGRFYTGSEYGYQSLSKEERATILIDNKKTTELDFSGLHPRILYAWEKIQYDGDPYAIIPEMPEMRPVFKKIFLALLNAENEIIAVQAGNKFLYENRKYYNLMRKKGLKIKDDLIPRFKEVHAPIAHYFCKATGLKVMNFDAKIALEIIKHFANKDIPVLAIHDSFIVWKYLKQELKEVMTSVYRKKTKGFICPVK